jgi:predicted alpha/beta-hydrolase family hydrolase
VAIDLPGSYFDEAAVARNGIVLTHGAGANAGSKLLLALSREFTAAGISVLRYNLPFRQRGSGPPRPGDAEKDRDGLRQAVQALRGAVPGRVFLGGHSYGGRQSSILAASGELPADALLLLAYPLHPPGKPEQLRTSHFPALRTPALFVQGSRDPFGSPAELEDARRLIPARTSLLMVEGAGHDLSKRGLPETVFAAFREFTAGDAA